MKYARILDSIASGRLNRLELSKIKANAESKFAQGDHEALDVINAINVAVPSDRYVLFMGFCPDADFDNRLDMEWKEKGICRFDWDESPVQMERFHSICAGDLVVLKKREKFGKTMRLFGHGRVASLATDEDGYRYLKMQWAPQDEIVEVPLLGCNSTVDIREMDRVQAEMPDEFFRWLGE